MALGGVLAALAVIVMAMGTLIPVATYVCPVICMLLLQTVCGLCGSRTGWAWYGAVAILCLLMAPDKEAAAVFAALGYYPIVRPWLERRRFSWFWKGLLFNGVIAILYWLLLKLLGIDQVVADYQGMGLAMTAVMVLLGNVTFFLLDMLLKRGIRIRNRQNRGR